MTADRNGAATRDAGPGVERLLALSDGVVAIAITLLVLQLNVPEPAKLTNPASASELATQIGKDADQLISYVISFYVIAQFWLIHHRVFRRITKQREGLAWWNFAFLFTVSVMPFTSDLQGKFADNPFAVDIFAANVYLRQPQESADRCIPARNAGCSGAFGGKHIHRCLVDRHRLGKHRCRQILLAAACRRPQDRRSLVQPSTRLNGGPLTTASDGAGSVGGALVALGDDGQ